MRQPMLTPLYQQSVTTDVWGGIDRRLRIGDGMLSDEANMSADRYPVLAPRRKRGVYLAGVQADGLIAKDALCYVADGKFRMNEYAVDMELEPGEKTMVSMGAYVVILPDKKYINTADITDRGKIENSVVTEGKVQLHMATLEGDPLQADYISSTAPEEPADGQMWLDTGSKPNILKQWSESSGMWVSIPTTYIKISAPGIGSGFQQYDGVQISGLEGEEAEEVKAISGSFVLWGCDEDWILIVGQLAVAAETTAAVTVERRMPEMDFLIESENRLWGCRYGTARNGSVVNEIYACKLGDFKNWECYMGTAADSYAVTVGTDGGFTGAVNYGGYPLFFKENCLHKIYGNYPATYRVDTLMCRGVAVGSERSLAAVNEILLYLGRNGVCAYDGSLPKEISANLGTERYSNGVAGAIGSKYYIAMDNAGGETEIYCYDMDTRTWHREDGAKPREYCTARNELYWIDEDGSIRTVNGTGDQEEDVHWYAVTGDIGISEAGQTQKYLSKIVMRLSMAEGARCEIMLKYDDMGTWDRVARLRCTTLKSYTMPIRPRRCDHLKLGVRGVGDVRIYSIVRVIEHGSDNHPHDGEVLDF